METMVAGAHTWICPACSRRVPLRVGACHCGMARDRAEEIAAAEARTSQPASRPVGPPAVRAPRTPGTPLPSDVRALLAGVAVVALAAMGWLAFGPRPDPVVPVLGFVDAGPPPAPRPSGPPEPAFRLPWWK